MLCKKHLEARLIGKGGEAHSYESRTTLDNMTNWQLTWNLYPPCWTAKCKWNHSEVIFSTHSCEVEVIMSMCSSTGADIKVGVLNSSDFIISVFFSTAASCFLWSTHVRPYCTNWYKLLDEYPVGPTGDKAPGIQPGATDLRPSRSQRLTSPKSEHKN